MKIVFQVIDRIDQHRVLKEFQNYYPSDDDVKAVLTEKVNKHVDGVMVRKVFFR